MNRLILVLVVLAFQALGAGLAADEVTNEPSPLEGVSLGAMKLNGQRYEQVLDDGRTVHFTPEPYLQQFAEHLFERYDVPAGAAVVLNTHTGRVLAMSQYRGKKYAANREEVALDATAPAASVFKIVTTSALLEQTDVSLDTKLCYHGGGGGIYGEHLVDNGALDKTCRSLKTAFGFSTNAIFAKLSDRYLSRQVMATYAHRFGFGRELPFDVTVDLSAQDVPKERLEKARASAGFWHSHLSALHAAMIAQSIAQDGAMLKPYIVDDVVSAEGEPVYRAKPVFLGRTVSRETAQKLIEAMSVTVARGTARKGFRDERGRPYLPGVQVAGKTGTLNGKRPYRAYSWFVGLAPADKPEVSIAVLVVNEPKWRIKSAWTAAQILRTYFEYKKSK